MLLSGVKASKGNDATVQMLFHLCSRPGHKGYRDSRKWSDRQQLNAGLYIPLVRSSLHKLLRHDSEKP